MPVLTATRPPQALAVEHAYRPALDGLRAIAVLGVVTYHLGATWLPGGFLGVDLFFVLSGFLITSLLLDEIARHGRITYSAFIARRARRLLPALYLLLIVVCAWAAWVAAPEAIGDLRGAALAAVFYVANWFFIATSRSYFADAQGPSPLEHTWSLSIEEQFYLLWPVLLLLFVRRLSPRALMVVLALGIVGSVAFMATTYDSTDPSSAYFGTLSRVHELLVGCLLAYAVRRGLAMPTAWRWTAWIALGLIGIMMATVSDLAGFYYRGGSLAFCVIVAWLVLVLGAGPAGAGSTRALSWAPLVWIGMLSYGIYLWHWPLILWLTPASTGMDGMLLALVRIGATLAIAAASYYLLERPIRRGFVGSVVLTPRRLGVVVPAAMSVMVLVILSSTARATPVAADPDPATASTALAGSRATGAPVLAVVGDSVPKELMPTIDAEAARREWSVLPLAFGGCSVTGTFQVDERGRPFDWSSRCSDGLAALQSEAVANVDPQIVLWYSTRERFSVLTDGAIKAVGTREHYEQLAADLEAAYQRLAAGGADVVIILPTPRAPAAIGRCAAGASAPSECALDDAYYASIDALATSLRALAARHPDRVRLVDVADLLCPERRDCPMLRLGDAVVRPDGIHFSAAGAAWFVPLLLDRAGLAAGA